jgi:hypothetical protein
MLKKHGVPWKGERKKEKPETERAEAKPEEEEEEGFFEPVEKKVEYVRMPDVYSDLWNHVRRMGLSERGANTFVEAMKLKNPDDLQAMNDVLTDMGAGPRIKRLIINTWAEKRGLYGYREPPRRYGYRRPRYEGEIEEFEGGGLYTVITAMINQNTTLLRSVLENQNKRSPYIEDKVLSKLDEIKDSFSEKFSDFDKRLTSLESNKEIEVTKLKMGVEEKKIDLQREGIRMVRERLNSFGKKVDRLEDTLLRVGAGMPIRAPKRLETEEAEINPEELGIPWEEE